MHCRLRELTEDKKPMDVCQMESSSLGDTDSMQPVVRLVAENGMQSLSASNCSKPRKRKRQVVQVNGSIDDMEDAVKKNNDSLQNGEENIRRKKRKKLVASESDERHGTSAGDPTVAAADPKSALQDEVEIWIPNKRYKGPYRDMYAKLAGEGSKKIKCHSPKKDDSMPFMTFVPVDRTPVALVRKRNKLSQSEPKPLHKPVSYVTIAIY